MLIKHKLEEINSVVEALKKVVKPFKYEDRLWMVGARSDREIATDLTIRSLELLEGVLMYSEATEPTLLETLSCHLAETADAVEGVTYPPASSKFITDLRRLTDEIEVLSLLEFTDEEVNCASD